jgi:hypothetical protein
MATTDRGRALFESLVEYPLPAKSGVQDYIFYFVPSEQNHGYGWSSRVFFGAFYGSHKVHEVKSLEELINVLYAEVTQHGVHQIREIIIVTHANSQAMLFPILAAQPSVFPYINEHTLAQFQKRVVGDFPSFNTKRSAVVAHLQDDSWVTIRGCNFGNARAAMYATYSFFGGRADVYAPILFQHFAIYPMDQFSKLNTPSKLHAHLVHQHFYRKEMTPERKRSVIGDLYQPAMFSAPHKFASRSLSNPTADEKAKYEALIDDLNKGKKSAALVAGLEAMMATFSVPDWSPSASAEITTAKDRSWVLSDGLKHDGISYHIYHQIYEKIDAGIAMLQVQARLEVDDGSSRKDGPAHDVVLQMFLDEGDDDSLYGRLIRLAGYTEKDEKTDRQQRFNAVLAALKSNELADSSASPAVDVVADFKSGLAVDLVSPQLKLVTPATWGDTTKRAIWSLDDGTNHYLIKLENPATRAGVLAHTITVYSILTEDAQTKREMAYLADHTDNQDTPGTELAAYFDRLSIDDLLSVVLYLRDPFKPGNALYIHHAQQAMKRKQGFEDWVWQQHPELRDPHAAPLIEEWEWELHTWEKDDIKESSYQFDFNNAWFEVKAFMTTGVDPQDDLFLNESLAQKLKLTDDSALLDPETDSPAPAVRPPSAFEAQFASSPADTDKALFDEPEDSTAGCQDFEEVITKFVAMSGQDAEQINAMLETQKTSSGASFVDVIKGVTSKYSFLRTMVRFTEIPKLSKLPWLPSSQDGLVTEPVKRILEHELKTELAWWAETEGAVETSTVLLQNGLGLLWSWSVIMIPAKMLNHIAEEEEHTDEVWQAIGQLTAIRQYLRRVADACYLAKSMPDLHEIDVSTPVSTAPGYSGYTFANQPYYIGRYFLEQFEEDPAGGVSYPIWGPDRMKEGYDQGITIMKFKVIDELVHRAEHGMDAALEKLEMDSCKIRVLTKAGLLDVGALQAQVVGELADAVRNKLRRL